MNSGTYWYGAKFMEDLADAYPRAWEKIGRMLRDKVKEKISSPFPPASEPGDPPHARTYTLYDSIDYLILEGPKGVLIGTPVPYAVFLERGTSVMEARPFLQCTLEENADEAVALFHETFMKRRVGYLA